MINTAIIGSGYWGINYVRLLQDLPHVRLSAVCDEDPSRLRSIHQRFPNLAVTIQMEDIFNRPEIDAVVVATPAVTHYEIVKRALESKKHVLVEKPMATSVADCESLVEIGDQCKKILMVGLTFLYNPGVEMLRGLISEPGFGRIYYLHCTRTNMGPIRQDVSSVWDLASHDLAICNFIMKWPPIWVQANGSKILDHQRDDVAFITLCYPGDVLANIHVSWINPSKVRQVVVVGSQRRIVFDDLDISERIRIFEKGIESSPDEVNNFGEFKFLIHDGEIRSPKVPAEEPLRNQVEHFLKCIETGCNPISNGRVGLENVRLLSAIDQSLSQNGARIGLNEKNLVGADSRIIALAGLSRYSSAA
ncbi:MAG: Gfo/Idh/MocA family oxidoreductase [Armatimonadetes bacterium]|nr:Gfo/Idh/MocA family oxidoreductase [Armatimonadota bacterium]